MIFFKDSTAKHNKKVIHPTKSQPEAHQDTNSLKSGQKTTPISIQNSSPEKEIPILEDHSKVKDEHTEIISTKQNNNDHRDVN